MRPLTTASLALALSLGGVAAIAPVASQAQVGFGVSVGVAPPPLPYYDQPPIPGPGYIWTPGYWAWSDYYNDYYWVPGTWVRPPRIGFLWTPAWWGFRDGVYLFNAGYWGPVVGFYGGIAYGFGYTGYGYEGGYWRGHDFYYNRTVNNVTNNITNVYNRPVYARVVNRVSFNGPGGAQARPTSEQLAAARAPRFGPTSIQQQHFQMARTQPALRASYNHGAPPIAATARPAMLRGPGVMPAAHAAAPYHPQPGPYRPPAAAEHANIPGRPPTGYSGGDRAPGNYGDHHPAPRPPEAYGGGYHSAPRPPEVYRPAPHPPEAYGGGGGGLRPPAAARPPQPGHEARPAPTPQAERREPPHRE